MDELSAARAALSAALDVKMAELLEAAAGGRSAQEQLDELQASHSTQPRHAMPGRASVGLLTTCTQLL